MSLLALVQAVEPRQRLLVAWLEVFGAVPAGPQVIEQIGPLHHHGEPIARSGDPLDVFVIGFPAPRE